MFCSIFLTAALLVLSCLSASAAGTSSVTAAEVSGEAGRIVTLAVSISNAAGIAGYQMDITYDPAVAIAAGVQNGLSAPVCNFNYSGSGKIIAAWASTQALQPSGTLFSVQFKLKGSAGASCPVVISNLAFNDVNAKPVSVRAVNGKLSISGNSGTQTGDSGTGTQPGAPAESGSGTQPGGVVGTGGAGSIGGAGGAGGAAGIQPGSISGTGTPDGGQGFYPSEPENPMIGAITGTGNEAVPQKPPVSNDEIGESASIGSINPGSALSIDITESAKQKTSNLPSGGKVTEFDLNENKINEILAKQNHVGSFLLDMQNASQQNAASFNGSIVSTMTKKDVSFFLKTNDVSLSIPTNIFDMTGISKKLGTSADKIEITLKVTEQPPESNGLKTKLTVGANQTLTRIGKIVRLEIIAKSSGKTINIDNFGQKSVQGVLSYTDDEIANVSNINQLGVFKYNAKTKMWEQRPGYVDVRKKQVVFYTHTFSDYSILENRKTFSDIAKHKAKNDIELLASRNIASAVSGTSFKPDVKLTRADFLNMLVNSICLEYIDPAYLTGKNVAFTDIKPTSAIYKNLTLACKAGIITNTGKKTFSPNAFITREDAAFMTAKAYDVVSKMQKLTAKAPVKAIFKDTGKLSTESQKAISEAVGLGIMDKTSDNKFIPAGNITRAQGASIICRFLKAVGRM